MITHPSEIHAHDPNHEPPPLAHEALTFDSDDMTKLSGSQVRIVPL